MDIAISRIYMMKNSIVRKLIAHQLYRTIHRNNYNTLVFNPIFYKRSNGNNRCLCGSDKKYKKCCKTVINNYNKLKIKGTYHIKWQQDLIHNHNKFEKNCLF